MFKKILFILVLLMVLIGCQSQPIERDLNLSNGYNLDLVNIFPKEKNFTWHYDGIVEYGHDLQIVNFTEENGSYIIDTRGVMTEGIGPIDHEGNLRDFTIKYYIDLEKIIEVVNYKENNLVSLPSIIPKKTVLKYPLELKNSWEETFEIGTRVYRIINVISNIEEVRDENNILRKRYTVNTETFPLENYKDGIYKETRVFEEGKGMISFSNTLPLMEEKNEKTGKIELKEVGFDFQYWLTSTDMNGLNIK